MNHFLTLFRPRLNSAKHIRSPATVTNIANTPTSVTLLNEASNPGEELVSSIVGIGKRSKVTVSEPRFGEATGLHFPVSDSRPDFASFSSDNEESSRAIDVSLFVEPGSIRHLDGTSSESSPDVETPGELWTAYPEGHSQEGEGSDAVANEIIPRSPNRRASEIFAFLDPVAGIYSDESFEIGTMSGKEEPDQFSPRSPRMTEADQDLHAQNQSNNKPSRQAPLFSVSLSGNSPSKRPIGPRTTATFDSKYTSSSNGKGALNVTSPVDAPSQSSTNNIPTLSATPQEQSSPAPLTGATFASDSFASQNTTDRSLYRGIYKYLNATPSSVGQSKMITVEGSANDVPLEASLGDDRNPFLTTDFDFDKSLPITPDSPSASDNDSHEALDKTNRRAGDFVPLPVFSPISPLSTNIVTSGPSEADKSPTPAPRNPKNSVKERVAMWESTKPLGIEKGSIQRRSSNSNHLASAGKSVRWSGDTSLSKRSGLGDGRGFNVPHVVGRMYGPRASPGRKLTNRAMSQRAPIPSAKNTKPADLAQNYPFSQDCTRKFLAVLPSY
jgi:hypothetical protein